ncbi:MAG: SH3 domain-containing protein [Proteobacteria bacterium]|nr:SH3 domain-containing protein [Pseudomonadota bacterium]
MIKISVRPLLKRFLFIGSMMSITTASLSANLPATLFPLDNYDQSVVTWLPPTDPDYHKPLISSQLQQRRMKELYQHLFSTAPDAMSPWSDNFVNAILAQHPGLPELESSLLKRFSNRDKDPAHINYAENFRPYSSEWIDKIANNIQTNYPSSFLKKQRAIAVKNTSIRLLPTSRASFYSYEIAGQGYPFDNLQVSRLWAGTPVYVFEYSKDFRWALIAAPAAIGWVEAEKLAKVDDAFISRWQQAVQVNLIAITDIKVPIFSVSKTYQFSAYIGTIFPLAAVRKNNYTIFIPVRDTTGRAQIQPALINHQYAEKMPLAVTRANFAKLFTKLKNRPYGWGGLYNYNDCSAELESLFRPFGIWLPRQSPDQVYMGKIEDQTSATPTDRIAYLREHGRPLMTIVYIGGHIFLYVGNYSQNGNATSASTNVMTYQDIWGLRPSDDSSRAIIGQSLFFPLLLAYPEEPNMVSLAAKNYFQVSYLDQMPETPINMPARFFSDL